MMEEIKHLFATPIGAYKLNLDLDNLIKFSYKQKSNRSISNRGGIQTQDLNFNKPPLKKLSEEILNCAENYSRQLSLKNNLILKNLWININKTNNFNIEHSHPFSIISGTFYVQANENSGNIVFKNPNETIEHILAKEYLSEYNQLNANVWWYKPIPNMLLLFPSWLKHYVEPNLSEEDRISISFNMHLK
jgi:uncharacterized protein (TIGR02466 family)